ncbi:MAG: aspartate aminotransferase family protein [Rhodospirillales bacterium]|nr:aspartate aminotransferase family protein [Rhodospirillales bacterium]
MTNIFQRQIHDNLPRAAKGDGIYIIDTDGKRYLDASGGAAVSCLGHSDADVIQAIKDQVDVLAFAHTGFFTSAPAEDLAEHLIGKAPDGIDAAYFVSGGSEAIEAALKMARQYFLEIGEPDRARFIARRQSYHGNTLGALSTGGNVLRRKPFEPMLMDVSHIAPCYAYRGQGQGGNEGEGEEEYGLRVADELEAEIQRLGPGNVCAFIAETVVGATLGVAPPVPGYFKRIREICDRHGVLLILDEVMCGMGRTGTIFACEQDGIAPDIVCVAKGLGGGYQPIGAALVSDKIFRAFRDGSGFFQHGHTYMGHPTACAAALAVQRKIQSLGLLANVQSQGEALEKNLLERLGNHANVGDIRGRGLFRGIELVADRATKEPLDPGLKVHALIKAEAMARGLICYPGGGTVDGAKGDHILLAPPFIIEDSQIRDLVEILGDSIDAALKSAGV